MSAADGYSDFHYTAGDGLKLHARVYGDRIEGLLPVVCLPGLTRNARDFHDLGLFLSRDRAPKRKVVAFDYRGRGESAYDRNWKNYEVVVEAADIVSGMIALGIDRAAFIGTSRGGLIVHVLAAMRPSLMRAVVLNDIGPVVEGEGLVHIRSYLERAPVPKTFEDAIAIQRAAHGSAFPALTDADWERLARALYREEKGKLVLDFDPKLLRQLRAIDLNKPLPTLWPQFEGLYGVPMLAIRGENSRLMAPSTLLEMTLRHPDIETITVEGQGHAPMLETGKLPERIAAFLDRAEGRVAAAA